MTEHWNELITTCAQCREKAENANRVVLFPYNDSTHNGLRAVATFFLCTHVYCLSGVIPIWPRFIYVITLYIGPYWSYMTIYSHTPSSSWTKQESVYVCGQLCTVCVRIIHHHSWWRHQMETLSALLALCAWNSPVTSTRASDAELWCFHWSGPEWTRLSKQSWGWWFETPSRPLRRHSYAESGLALLTLW